MSSASWRLRKVGRTLGGSITGVVERLAVEADEKYIVSGNGISEKKPSSPETSNNRHDPPHCFRVRFCPVGITAWINAALFRSN